MYSVGLIGCGRISCKHVEGFVTNADRLTLTAVCDPVGTRARETAEDYQKSFPGSAIGVYADYREMLDNHKPDIVTIATESGKHSEIAIMCMEAGSHVIYRVPEAKERKTF